MSSTKSSTLTTVSRLSAATVALAALAFSAPAAVNAVNQSAQPHPTAQQGTPQSGSTGADPVVDCRITSASYTDNGSPVRVPGDERADLMQEFGCVTDQNGTQWVAVRASLAAVMSSGTEGAVGDNFYIGQRTLDGSASFDLKNLVPTWDQLAKTNPGISNDELNAVMDEQFTKAGLDVSLRPALIGEAATNAPGYEEPTQEVTSVKGIAFDMSARWGAEPGTNEGDVTLVTPQGDKVLNVGRVGPIGVGPCPVGEEPVTLLDIPAAQGKDRIQLNLFKSAEGYVGSLGRMEARLSANGTPTCGIINAFNIDEAGYSNWASTGNVVTAPGGEGMQFESRTAASDWISSYQGEQVLKVLLSMRAA